MLKESYFFLISELQIKVPDLIEMYKKVGYVN